ncbi:MAG: 3-oxoacyl-ACP reductase FabG [Caldilineales bacterium]|nr:3-oxoacyl-ACP reductase FabG [Caldilineales bacterium]
MRFQDKVILITGGAAGIGRATAIKFANEGGIVIICDVDEQAGRAVAEEFGFDFFRVNVADRADVQRWVDAVVAEHGRIDVLVNNAGVLRDGMLVKMKDGELVKQMPEADWDLVISVNLKGVFNCTQAVAPIMINQGSGVILNASSVVGLDGNFGQSNYVATKAGVIGMTKVWARELGRYGIRVNAVAPGFILTEMVKQMPEKVLEQMVAHVPLSRMGEVGDIANAYAFLASDEAGYISGAVLRVDGGIVVGT